MDRGDFVAPSKITVGEFLQSVWLPEAKDRVRPSTFESYRLHVDGYIIPRLGRTRLQALRPNMLNKLYRDLRHSGSRTDGPLSARTVELTHTVIRRALKDAELWGLVSRNVADAANRPRNARAPEMETWTAQQLAQFLDHVRESDGALYPLWRLFATSGLRRGEALGARWQDLDLDAGRLAIRQTALVIDSKVVFGEPKTDRGRRLVSLDRETIAALRAHRKRQSEEQLISGVAYAGHGLIFADPSGRTLHPDRISSAFRRHVRITGLPRLSLHGLRHSHATLALQAGIHPKVVSERLGHSSVSLTLDTYSHAIPALQEEAAQQVAELIDGRTRSR